MPTMVLLYRVEVWAIASVSTLGKSLKMSKSVFLQSSPSQEGNTIHFPTSQHGITSHWDPNDTLTIEYKLHIKEDSRHAMTVLCSLVSVIYKSALIGIKSLSKEDYQITDVFQNRRQCLCFWNYPQICPYPIKMTIPCNKNQAIQRSHTIMQCFSLISGTM